MPQVITHLVGQSGRITATEAVLRQINPRDALELGAGDYSFRYVFDALPQIRWIRADFSQPTDLLVDLNDPQVRLPLPDASVDLVVATELLEHLLWPHALLRECARVLRGGGKAVISVPNAVSLSYRLAWLLGRIPSCAACGNLPPHLGPTTYVTDSGGHIGGHVIDFNRHRLICLLKETGFEVCRVRGSGLFWHRTIVPYWLLPAALASNIIVVAAPVGERSNLAP